jgi:hypothetical protein
VRIRHNYGYVLCAVLALLSVTGCTVGPNYHKPDAPTAPAFKEDADVTPPPNPANGGWKRAQPGDDSFVASGGRCMAIRS